MKTKWQRNKDKVRVDIMLAPTSLRKETCVVAVHHHCDGLIRQYNLLIGQKGITIERSR